MRKLTTLILLLATTVHAQDDDMLAGLHALRLEDHQRAERAFSAVVERSPADARAWYYRAVNRLAKSDATGARHDLDRLLDMEPGHAHGYLRRAEAHTQLGHAALAGDDLRMLLRFHPEGPAAEHALLQLGHLAMIQGAVKEALGHYDHLLRLAPEHAMGLCNRGITHAALDQDHLARHDLEAAIALDPRLDQAHANLGIVLLRMGERTQACGAFQRALALGDRSVEEMLLIYCD